MNWYLMGGKRGLDIVVSVIMLVATTPLMAVVAVLLIASQGRPILFGQERAGRDGVPFTVLKFRTMRAASVGGGDSRDRVTQIGKILRKLSIDELPQLINILRGDMSLVGPRPLYVRYTPRYSSVHRRRLDVRPGLTGLVQVSGRNLLSWDERFDLDVKYVQSVSLLGDLRILLRTARIVLSPGREGLATVPSAEYLGADQGGTS